MPWIRSEASWCGLTGENDLIRICSLNPPVVAARDLVVEVSGNLGNRSYDTPVVGQWEEKGMSRTAL